MHVTFPELQQIVASNDKKRFVLEPVPLPFPSNNNNQKISAADPSRWRVRAAQGHSLKTLSDDKIYTRILETDADCPSYVVHGTYDKPWQDIKKSGGLKPMGRTHIHFADRLPKKLPPLDPVFQSKSKMKDDGDTLISGMRPGATIVVWVDVKKSLRAGVEWWRSENKVFLTKGRAADGEDGGVSVLGFEFIKWVERRKENGNGELLFGEKVPSIEIPEKATEDRSDVTASSVDKAIIVEEKRHPEVKERVNAVIKDRWDDGDD